LNGEAFSDEEIEFLQRMLFVQEYSGAPPFSGWYADLFYEPEDAAKIDFIVADVHTQPTDIGGSVVGRILHVGVGKINLGVFIADSPSDDFRQMAFVGPVMSYYEKITGDFDRLTDERWTDLVNSSELPARPDWVNVYLADYDGNVMTKGRELPAVKFTQTSVQQEINPGEFCLLRNYPNPFNSATTIYYTLPQDERVNLTIYDVLGQKIVTLADDIQPAGYHTVKWNAGDVSSGIYFCRIQAGTHDQAIKMLLMQ